MMSLMYNSSPLLSESFIIRVLHYQSHLLSESFIIRVSLRYRLLIFYLVTSICLMYILKLIELLLGAWQNKLTRIASRSCLTHPLGEYWQKPLRNCIEESPSFQLRTSPNGWSIIQRVRLGELWHSRAKATKRKLMHNGNRVWPRKLNRNTW